MQIRLDCERAQGVEEFVFVIYIKAFSSKREPASDGACDAHSSEDAAAHVNWLNINRNAKCHF